MRFSAFILVLSAFLTLASGSAHAKSWWDWIFPPPVPDFTKLQHEDGKTPQPMAYQTDPVKIQDWVQARGGEEALLNDLYADDVIRDWDADEDVPELEVGRNFMRLSNEDKQNVAAFIDRIYKVTESGGVFHVVHWHSRKAIGLYDPSGLRLQ